MIRHKNKLRDKQRLLFFIHGSIFNSLGCRWSDHPPPSPYLEMLQHISIYLSALHATNGVAVPFLSFNMVLYLNEDLIIHLGFF